MKKLNHILFLLVTALCGLSLTGCSNDDLNTDQYGNDIALNAFGPCPVLRGGTLYFIGSNLDQISEIDLPGADPITQFEVIESGRHSKISITVPAEKCDTGIVVLKTVKGGEIKTLTAIRYREDIVVKDFFVGSDENNKTGNVGDIVTIKGDYLNLFKGIIFADKDTVRADKFVAHDRYTIKVAIPMEAKTGEFKLTDLAETPNEIETEKALIVNLPTVTSLSNDKPKAGQSVTVNGTSLDQIKGIVLKGATVAEKDLQKSTDGKQITFTIPANASDGEIQLVTYSGVEIPAGSITTVVPSGLTAAPAPVKNGAVITITGKDLDLVTSIKYPNADGVIKTVAANKVTSEVPEAAQEGDITLGLANGKSVTVAYTLVKPAVTSFTPNVIMAGNKIMLRGRNLDLVASITFPGETPVTAEAGDTKISATAIGTIIPTSAVGRGCTLNLKNGTTVSVSGLTINAATDPVLSETASGVIGEYVTVNGKNFNNVEAVYIGKTKVTKFKSHTDHAMTFLIPSTIAAGTHNLQFVGPDGTKYNGGKIVCKPKDVDVATLVKLNNGKNITYPFNFTWDDNGRFIIPLASLESFGFKAGTRLVVYKPTTSKGQVQINNNSWAAITTIADWNPSESQLSYTFTEADVQNIKNTGGIVIQGDLPGITKMVFTP
ncbi:IPT/TIG domain-containing protein [Segatella baroniae]|uniref:IPT/TIG domain-containing protein n=1 Tax=Segatella baroniae TaxID=305719 RepID=UPI0028E52384|nr:IPT/TIG domain-containing protein [Segatella baroniae]